MDIKKVCFDLLEAAGYFDDVNYHGGGTFSESLPNRLHLDIDSLRDFFGVSGTYFEILEQEQKTMIYDSRSLHSIIIEIEIIADYLDSILSGEPCDYPSGAGDSLFEIVGILKAHFNVEDE